MSPRKKTRLLWTAQGFLAVVFLFTGGMKLLAPAAMLAGPVALPIAFLRFIGAAEALGAIGLVAPGIFRIHTELTPLAATGLAMIMAGATVITLEGGLGAVAAVPAFLGVLATAVV